MEGEDIRADVCRSMRYGLLRTCDDNTCDGRPHIHSAKKSYGVYICYMSCSIPENEFSGIIPDKEDLLPCSNGITLGISEVLTEYLFCIVLCIVIMLGKKDTCVDTTRDFSSNYIATLLFGTGLARAFVTFKNAISCPRYDDSPSYNYFSVL